ncbi:MAG: hypothetical protein J6V98_00565 [Bacteroidales bacterium]|nr:hypothetical protein [Bacteroidales bacterium]
MKRLLYIMLLPLLVLVACSREVEETPLYRQYASRADLTVAQVAGFQLNDSVKVDVVILVADDSVAWQSLKEELDIRTSEGVTSWMGNIDHPQQRVKRSERPAWRAMAVHGDMTVAFYRMDDNMQYEALVDYQMENIKRSETDKKELK